ncbi:MAG: phosphopentomutase, partial [Clostridiales bacterium]|nr:phosphopentomutase [Clostridiales bacterium]
VIQDFEKAIHRKTIGNVVASGTEIIKQLGEEHMKTGSPIVYTSADSVFQIAAHEDIIPIESLYEMCRIARGILKDEHAVGRVIARPFTGTPGNFNRTDRRRDFSLNPIGKSILDLAAEKGLEVKAVGKIEDIYNKQGITEAVHTHDNMDGVDKTLEYLKQEFEGILFTNLVDFDMLFGHRNNAEGYAQALMKFDERLPEILQALKDEDLLFIVADHGCDPTTPSTDHSREYVPLLVYGSKFKQGINLGIRETFADVAATIAEFLDVKAPVNGTSFYSMVAR